MKAKARLRRPTLVLAPGWSDAITVNSIQRQPASSWSDDGRVVLAYRSLAPGQALTAYLYLQVNPTTVGRRDQGVELRDGNRFVTSVDRTVTVFP